MADVDLPVGLQPLADQAIIAADVDGIATEFNIGTLAGPTGAKFEIIVVAIGPQGQGALVAFPGQAWDKRAGKRKLPQGCIQKAVILSVPGADDFDRSVASSSTSVQVWLGWLGSDQYPSISFGQEEDHSFKFDDTETGLPCLPFAEAIAEAARDKFSIPCQHLEEPEAGVATTPEQAEEAPTRVQKLETKLNNMENLLQEILSAQKDNGGTGFVSAQESAAARETPRPSAPPVKVQAPKVAAELKPSPKTRAVGQAKSYVGLDPAAVAAARTAGVTEEHLAAMDRVVRLGPGGLGDAPNAQMDKKRPAPQVLDSECEEEELPEAENVSSQDPLSMAVIHLSKIAAQLTKSKGPDALEDSLDFGGGSGSADGGGLSRRHAAVVRALKKAFREEPRKLWVQMEANMQEDYALASSRPNQGPNGFSVRGWAEHRSKVQPYARTVRAMWGVAGVLDSLRAGEVDSAICRCYIMMAQFEQESLDRGSYLLAQEFALEPSPPVSSFQQHHIPEPTEMAHTRIMDGRWVEAFAHHLKDVDTYMEMRKKLGSRAKDPPGTANPGKGTKDNPKGSAKQKGKGSGKKSQEAEPAAEE